MREPQSMFLPLTAIEAEVYDIVSRLSYGDDWHFEMMRGEHCFVRITWAVRDLVAPPIRPLWDEQGQYGSAYRRGWTYLSSSVNVGRLEAIIDGAWLDAFLQDLWAAIAELEGHERLERLRVDGIPVWTPHPPGEQQIAPGRLRSTPAGLKHSVRIAGLPSRGCATG